MLTAVFTALLFAYFVLHLHYQRHDRWPKAAEFSGVWTLILFPVLLFLGNLRRSTRR